MHTVGAEHVRQLARLLAMGSHTQRLAAVELTMYPVVQVRQVTESVQVTHCTIVTPHDSQVVVVVM
jgi:hypothetical protein